jgi:hypothetical protein
MGEYRCPILDGIMLDKEEVSTASVVKANPNLGLTAFGLNTQLDVERAEKVQQLGMIFRSAGIPGGYTFFCCTVRLVIIENFGNAMPGRRRPARAMTFVHYPSSLSFMV